MSAGTVSGSGGGPRTPTPPPTDDGGAAMAEAVDALIAAVGGEFPSDRETAARAALLAAHAEALAAAESRGRLDPRGVAAGYAYSAGHEDALRDVAELVANCSEDLDDFYDRVSALVAHLWPLPEPDAPADAQAVGE